MLGNLLAQASFRGTRKHLVGTAIESNTARSIGSECVILAGFPMGWADGVDGLIEQEIQGRGKAADLLVLDLLSSPNFSQSGSVVV